MVSIETRNGKELVTYSEDEKKKALEYFVTSITDPIYAVKHTVPVEVFGSFGSFFSRNPRDLREHLMDAVVGNIPGFELDPRLGKDNLEKLLSGHYKGPSEAITSGLAKSQQFFGKWYGKYSHKSIANTVWIPMVANNVSQLFARELAYDQLAFFIEQSSRFVKMDSRNYFMDRDIEDSSLEKIYRETVELSFSTYDKLTNRLFEEFSRKLPYKKWLLQGNEGGSKIAYRNQMKGKALDTSRFLLPQATFTNIAWILDARSSEFDIGSWKGHALREISEAARLYEKHAGQIAPSLLKYTDENEFYSDKRNRYNGDLDFGVEVSPVRKSFNFLEFPDDSLNKTVAHLLQFSNRGNFSLYYERAKRMTFEEKINVLERVVCKRKSFDEWVGAEEEFNMVNVTGEIITDIGAIRDWRRHQKFNRLEPLYSLDMGYTIPASVEEIGGESLDLFHESMEKAHEAELKIRKDFPYQAQYVIPMACNHSITFSEGLDQWFYTLFTRSTPEGNWSYRQDSFNMTEALLRRAPWIVGYKEYPEDKNIIKVYEDAPFAMRMREQQKEWEEKGKKGKEPYPGLLILRTEKTRLHT